MFGEATDPQIGGGVKHAAVRSRNASPTVLRCGGRLGPSAETGDWLLPIGAPESPLPRERVGVRGRDLPVGAIRAHWCEVSTVGFAIQHGTVTLVCPLTRLRLGLGFMPRQAFVSLSHRERESGRSGTRSIGKQWVKHMCDRGHRTKPVPLPTCWLSQLDAQSLNGHLTPALPRRGFSLSFGRRFRAGVFLWPWLSPPHVNPGSGV